MWDLPDTERMPERGRELHTHDTTDAAPDGSAGAWAWRGRGLLPSQHSTPTLSVAIQGNAVGA